MKTTIRSATLALAATLSLGSPRLCQADPRNPKPDWVDASSMEYPREHYVIGVGAADDRATAEDRARGEIAKVFSTNVSINTDSTATETVNGGQNNFSQAVSQTVKTASQKVLEGVQVVENWQDSATKVYYALAVLDKAKARAAIADKIGALDSQAVQWKSQLDSATDKLAKAKAAMKLLRVLGARRELNNELRVVDDSGQGAKPPFDESIVKPAAAKAVAALDVSVQMAGNGAPEVETGIVSGLNAFGLQAIKGAKEGADLGVEGQLDSKPMEGDGSKWKWARSTVTLTLKDARSGKIVSQFDASDREASADYAEAVRRSHVEISKRIADKLSAAITSYFENE